MNAQTFHLVRECQRYEFRVHGDAVTIRFWDGSWCRTERTRTREEAREEYGRLARRGWQSW